MNYLSYLRCALCGRPLPTLPEPGLRRTCSGRRMAGTFLT